MNNKKNLPFIWKPLRYKAKWVTCFADVPICDPLYETLKKQQGFYPRVVVDDCATQYIPLVKTSHPVLNLEYVNEMSETGNLQPTSDSFDKVVVLREQSNNVHVGLANLFPLVKDLPKRSSELNQAFENESTDELREAILGFVERFSVLDITYPVQDCFNRWISSIKKIYFFSELLVHISFAKTEGSKHINIKSWKEQYLQEQGTEAFLPDSFFKDDQNFVEFKELLAERLWWEAEHQLNGNLHAEYSNDALSLSNTPLKFDVTCGALIWCYFELWYDLNKGVKYRHCNKCGNAYPYQRATTKYCSSSCRSNARHNT